MLFLLVSANAMPIYHEPTTYNNCMYYSFILTLIVFYIITVSTIYCTQILNKTKRNDNYDYS